jgi:hypothetical protein
MSSSEIPSGAVQDNDYTMRTSQKGDPIPVQSDDAKVEDPIDAEVADSEEQLGIILPYFPPSQFHPS